ncbi:MAG: hypothetical protein ACXWU9_13735 [Telluria sp.]
MRIPKTAVLLALALGLPAVALAGPGSAPAEPAPAQNLKPDPKALKKPLLKRRSVQQVVESTPRIPVVTEGYRPTLHPAAPRTAVTGTLPAPALPSASAPPLPQPPAQVNSCIGNGCNDTSGTRYTGGVGNTVLDPQGRNCTRTGSTIQCF